MTSVWAVLVGATIAAGSTMAAGLSVSDRALADFEARLVQDPSSLRVAAEYRQLVITTGRYDRSIKLFERLAKDPRGGAHGFLNLALANVDKVPVSGSVRRALLGRDALNALTRAIAIEPTDLAYLVRGLVNLYYDQFVFHRTDKGVADLEMARRLSSAHPRVAYMPRILVALGDGYWRLHQYDRAREVWREGDGAWPDVEAFRIRLSARDQAIPDIIEHALDAGVRVDTTLWELFPDLTRTASKAVP
ncbi:MAG: tetratricopeptide repeat protein [Vicinamibacterales bacterium]